MCAAEQVSASITPDRGVLTVCSHDHILGLFSAALFEFEESAALGSLVHDIAAQGDGVESGA